MAKLHSEMPAVVYKITNLVNGKFYVGVTTQALSKRLGQHVGAIRRSTGPLHSDIAEYGPSAFVIEPIAAFSSMEQGLEEERRFIAALSPAYNVLRGGRHERAVLCLDDGRRFDSATEAAAFYSTAKSAIIEVCLRNPRRAQAGGRVFRYEGDVFDITVELETAKHRTRTAGGGAKKLTKPVRCVEDGVVYSSATDAAIAHGFARQTINDVCLGKKKHAGGLHFTYNILPDEVK